MSTYPDLPAPRLALDVDGSQLLSRVDAGAWVDQSSHLATVMGVNGAGVGLASGTSMTEFCVFFPSAVSLRGFYAGIVNPYHGPNGYGYSYSLDTTNGTDGTWSGYLNQGTGTSGVNVPAFRQSIAQMSVDNVLGLRFKYNGKDGFFSGCSLSTVHVYGTYAQTGDRLQFWNPGNNLPLDANYLNYQDTSRGTTPTPRTFSVKNLSTTKTANNVQVTHTGMIGAGFASGAGTGVQLSLDGTNWFDTVGLGNLAPGAQSATIHQRIVIPSSLSVNPYASRLTISSDGMV